MYFILKLFFIYFFYFFAGATLCVGSEWHRYPSSFFVPDYIGEVRWIDDGFRGLLPFPFNSTLGGTASAPHYFNNKNKASDEQYVKSIINPSILYFIFPHSVKLFYLQSPFCSQFKLRDVENCTLLVELHLRRPYPHRGSDMSTWEV